MSSRAIVQRLNLGGYNFTEPDRHLVFSDYPIQYWALNCAPRESYLASGFKLGLPNRQYRDIMLVPPGSQIHLSEGQRYFNSRMSRFLADFISRYYEMHRHYNLNIFIDVQRAQLIDLNLREIAGRFIEVQSLKHKFAVNGQIKSSVWITREFDSSFELDRYFESGKSANMGKVLKYKFNGCIFDFYNSENCFPAFFANTDKYIDFTYLQHRHVNYTIEDFAYYNAYLGSEVPKGYYKSYEKI